MDDTTKGFGKCAYAGIIVEKRARKPEQTKQTKHFVDQKPV